MARLWADAEADYRERLLESLRPDPGPVLLDVGCDDGAWTEELRRSLDIPGEQVR